MHQREENAPRLRSESIWGVFWGVALGEVHSGCGGPALVTLSGPCSDFAGCLMRVGQISRAAAVGSTDKRPERPHLQSRRGSRLSHEERSHCFLSANESVNLVSGLPSFPKQKISL